MNTFFDLFFDEKNLENRIYEVAAPQGTMNFIETDMVIAKIKTTQGEEAQKIETVLRKIDFANGNVHHFLNHIAQAMAVDF
tara:strand:- start:239 stop:481 length:243 start_codon:yes stop_codon:yes gene_type:complete